MVLRHNFTFAVNIFSVVTFWPTFLVLKKLKSANAIYILSVCL
jgi:hypothetical protein